MSRYMPGNRIADCFFWIQLKFLSPSLISHQVTTTLLLFPLCHLDVMLIGSLCCQAGQSDVPQMSVWPIIHLDTQ